MTALDLDRELLSALRERAAERAWMLRPCAPTHAPSSSSRRDFDLCLVPMQTIQLLGGPIERVAFLRRARAHLRDGGLLAVRDRHGG